METANINEERELAERSLGLPCVMTRVLITRVIMRNVMTRHDAPLKSHDDAFHCLGF